MLEEYAGRLDQDPTISNTVDVLAMVDGSNTTLSSDFEHMGSILSTLTDDLKQEPLDPPLSEELRHAIINMEDNHYVRKGITQFLFIIFI
jgi:hypothetical protein